MTSARYAIRWLYCLELLDCSAVVPDLMAHLSGVPLPGPMLTSDCRHLQYCQHYIANTVPSRLNAPKQIYFSLIVSFFKDSSYLLGHLRCLLSSLDGNVGGYLLYTFASTT